MVSDSYINKSKFLLKDNFKNFVSDFFVNLKLLMLVQYYFV